MNYSGPESSKVKGMFQEIAGTYDKANNILSFGIHHLWRKKLIQYSEAKEGDSVLDCATGTGDLALEFKKIVKEGRVVGSDFCQGMLDHAPKKAKKAGLNVGFTIADVMNLPFEDNEFDITSISFGIRNVEDPFVGLKELGRVTKKGGKLMVLEFGQPHLPIFSDIYHFYSKKILPRIGGLISGKKNAYDYLENSSSQFPCREEFVQLALNTEAFTKVEYLSLSGGIAFIYKCSK